MKMEISKCDVLKELFNMGVGKAADMLSQITGQEITLRVPKIFLFDSIREKQADPDPDLLRLLNGTLMVSSITFSQRLVGKANLIFPTEHIHSFIDLCMGNASVPQPASGELTDIDFDVVKEVGNIVLNSILGTVGNFLEIPMSYSLPEVQIYNRKIDFSRDIESTPYKSVLLLSISFQVEKIKIEGAVLIDLTTTSRRDLLRLLNRVEAKFVG